MRGVALGALMIVTSACGADEVVPDAGNRPVDAPPVIDGMPGDAFSTVCSSPDGSATITTTGGTGGGTAFGRLYAGGLYEIGPVAPLGPTAPMQIYFVFANADPVEATELACCLADDDSCCTINSVVAGTTSIPVGTEVGTHDVTFAKTNGNAFSVAGTVNITTFVHPFTNDPGRVAGSVSASSGGLTVTGTFDNEFCRAFLSATI